MAQKNFVAAYADMLNGAITVQSVTTTADEGGGNTKIWSTKHEDIPASIQPLMGSKMEFAKKLQMDVTHIVYVGAPVTVANGDRITSGTSKYTVEWFEDQGGVGEVGCIWTRLVQE